MINLFKDYFVQYEFRIVMYKFKGMKGGKCDIATYHIVNKENLDNLLDYNVVEVNITATRRILGLFTTVVFGKSYPLVPDNRLTAPIWKHMSGRYLQFTSGFDQALIAKFGRYFDPIL